MPVGVLCTSTVFSLRETFNALFTSQSRDVLSNWPLIAFIRLSLWNNYRTCVSYGK